MDQITNCRGNEAREINARFQNKCDRCQRYFYIGERIVLAWAPNKQLFHLHRHCARLWKIKPRPIPKLEWKRVTRLRWRASSGKDQFEILRDSRSNSFGCIKNGRVVFAILKDLIVAQSRAEEEAVLDEF